MTQNSTPYSPWDVGRPAEARRMEDAIVQFLLEKPALAEVSLSLQRIYLSRCPQVTTAALSWDNCLLVDIDFIQECTGSNLEFVLLHEFLHRILRHFPRTEQLLDLYFNSRHAEMLALAAPLNSAAEITQALRQAGFPENQIFLFFAFGQIKAIAIDLPVNAICAEAVPTGILSYACFDKATATKICQETQFVLGKNLSLKILNQLLRQSALRHFPFDWQAPSQAQKDLHDGLAKKHLLDAAFDLPAGLSFEQYFALLLDKFQEQNSGKTPEDMAAAIDHEATQAGEEQDSSFLKDLLGDGHAAESPGPEANPEDRTLSDIVFKEIYERARDKQRRYELLNPPGNGTRGLLALLPEMTEISDRQIWLKTVNRAVGLCLNDDSFEECLMGRDRRDASPFGKRREEMTQRLIVVIDTSGSVANCINRFCGAIEKALRRDNLLCDLILCHDRVSGYHPNLRSFKKVKIMAETGGTDMRQAIRFIQEKYPRLRRPQVIMITDGETPWDGVPDNMSLSCIYTPQHSPLSGVRYSALIHL